MRGKIILHITGKILIDELQGILSPNVDWQEHASTVSAPFYKNTFFFYFILDN